MPLLEAEVRGLAVNLGDRDQIAALEKSLQGFERTLDSCDIEAALRWYCELESRTNAMLFSETGFWDALGGMDDVLKFRRAARTYAGERLRSCASEGRLT